jgi:diacylglycerol kinase (ATP)
MHVSLVHNAGSGAEQPRADELVEWLRAAGHEVAYQEMGHQVARSLAQPGDIVVVAGGDGTVADLCMRMVGRGVPLGILPLGTSNNIANAMKVKGHPKDLVDALATMKPRRLDVGFAKTETALGGFVEAVGLGMFANMLIDAYSRPAEPTADVTNGIKMLTRALEKTEPFLCEVVMDGASVSGEYLLVEVMNIDAIGARVVFAPDADPGDGKLDVVLLEAGDRALFQGYLERRKEGHFEPPPASHRRRVTEVTLRWRGAAMHLDDQPWPPNEVGQSVVGAGTVTIGLAETPLQVLAP